MSKPRFYLRARRYPEGKFVSIWLVRADGPAEASLLWGEVLPKVVAEIAAATGLAIEEQAMPVEGLMPLAPVGCASLPQQVELFGAKS